MELAVSNFLKQERLCVLSVLLANGELHGATVHYSAIEEPLRIIIQTSSRTEKAKPFLDGGTGKAAVTIGFDENEWLTLQMRGDVRLIPQEEAEEAARIHFDRHPGAKVHQRPDTIFLEFTPTSWKYSDYNTSSITIIKSHE
jgi:uncharacterized protein YhbP (UPF0306 family)